MGAQCAVEATVVIGQGEIGQKIRPLTIAVLVPGRGESAQLGRQSGVVVLAHIRGHGRVGDGGEAGAAVLEEVGPRIRPASLWHHVVELQGGIVDEVGLGALPVARVAGVVDVSLRGLGLGIALRRNVRGDIDQLSLRDWHGVHGGDVANQTRRIRRLQGRIDEGRGSVSWWCDSIRRPDLAGVECKVGGVGRAGAGIVIRGRAGRISGGGAGRIARGRVQGRGRRSIVSDRARAFVSAAGQDRGR